MTFTFKILGLPAVLWLLVILGQFVHVGMKIMQETTDATLAKYLTSPRKRLEFVLNFICSISLLYGGWIGYEAALVKYPHLNLEMYVGIGALFIGYGGQSLFGNVMAIAQKKADKID